MRWEDERYVRLYTRDSLTWIRLGWEGQAALSLLMRKVDRAGLLEIGDSTPEEAIEAVTGLPPEVCAAAWKRLTQGTEPVVTLCDGSSRAILISKFIDAQEALQSDKARQRKHRELARDLRKVTERDVPVTERDKPSHAVTRGHAASRAVTPNCAVPSCAVPSRTEPEKDQNLPAAKKLAAGPPALVPVVVPAGQGPPAGEKPESPTAPVWLAYSTAYRRRYGADPVRNATVNAQLAQLVKRLGPAAAEVAAFYVSHNAAFYVKKTHAVGPLLSDCEALHTAWKTGTQITETKARQIEKTQANADGWNSLLSKEGRKQNALE